MYAFFDQPWISALYHSKFNSFLDSIPSLFQIPNEEGTTLRSIIDKLASGDHTESSLIEKICRGSDTAQVSEAIRRAFVDFEIFKSDFSKEKLFDVLVNRVVEFLQINAEELSMYATVGNIERILPDKKKTLGSCDEDTDNDTTENYGYSGLPERGYHLPGTVPVLKQELACIIRGEDSNEKVLSGNDKVPSEDGQGSAILAGYKLSKTEVRQMCIERDLLKSLREKRMQDEEEE